MMKPLLLLLVMLVLLPACATRNDNRVPTIGELKAVDVAVAQQVSDAADINPQVRFKPDGEEVIKSYRELLTITPSGQDYGKELQRLADLELEDSLDTQQSDHPETAALGQRLSQLAIRRYQQYLDAYPQREDNDLIIYQLARAFAINGKPAKAQAYMDQLVGKYPTSIYRDEIQFRRGEYLFVESRYASAEKAYADIVRYFPQSQYYDKALYKLGWARFKQNHYQQALGSFIKLLDLKQQQGQIKVFEITKKLNRAEQELLQDVLRVVSLTFSYLSARQPITKYFNKLTQREYEPLLYKNLAALYLSKERISDATDVYLSYGEKYPLSRYASILHQMAIEANKKAGFSTLVLEEKIYYVEKYNRGTAYWKAQTAEDQAHLQRQLTAHVHDIATHFHALARATKKKRDFQTAANWYRLYLNSFPQDPRTADMNFLLAESLYDAGQFNRAIVEYEKTAYQYPPHKNSAEAGYAALLAYNQLVRYAKAADRPALNEKLIQSALNFSEVFAQDKRMPQVLLNTAQKLFELKNLNQARDVGLRLSAMPELDQKMSLAVWTLLAQSSFELKDYSASEQAYQKLIALTPGKAGKTLKSLRSQLAATIYKQGETARMAGNHQQAARHFIRASKILPGSTTAIVAEYDAATEYLALQDWSAAIDILERFRKRYPEQKKWRLGVSQKLTLAYNNAGKLKKAAAEMLTLAVLSPKKEQRDLRWQSAQLYEQAGDEKNAIKQYKAYIKKYPRPLSRSIELRYKIAQHYLKRNDRKRYHYWLQQIISADAKAKKQRTDRSRYLAAQASLALIKPTHQKFLAVKLTRPLKKSLKRKKNLMQQAVAAYSKAAKYQVAEVTTAATFNIAEIYREFATALLQSERPKKLDADALEEYNYMLEDQAYPFEEKAIAIHQANLSRIPGGIYDDAVKNSLKALAKLMPFRYAKVEKTDAYVE